MLNMLALWYDLNKEFISELYIYVFFKFPNQSTQYLIKCPVVIYVSQYYMIIKILILIYILFLFFFDYKLLLLNEIKKYINHQLNTFTKLKKNNVEKNISLQFKTRRKENIEIFLKIHKNHWYHLILI